jgi:tetratricopeptide (TPR) repeat protein
MSSLLPLIGAGVVVIVGLAVAYLFFLRPRGNKAAKKPRIQDRAVVLRAAAKKLAQDPRDPEANAAVADLYYREENYAEAHKHYRLLLDLCAANPGLNEFEITVRQALCALHAKREEEAYKGLMIAWSMDKSSFDVNHNLGVLEYKRKAYDRAESLLAAAQAALPAHALTAKYLGLAEFKLKKYAASSSLLRTWLDAHPEDKECLAMQGQCYFQMKRYDLASRIFSHLRPDPEHGPLACLYAATIRLNEKDYEGAIADLEIGLRHQNLTAEVGLEMRYRLAAAHMKLNRIEQATAAWRQIVAINPQFKDTKQLLKTYQELSANKYLHTYLLASSSEFVNLCRRLARVHFDEGTVKITDVALHGNEYADVLAEITAHKWEEIVLFRFLRSTGDVGDLLLRDLNARLKDIRASRGVCFTAGKFGDNARTFVEARLIDLGEKEQLLKLFDKLARKPQVTA